MTDNCQAAYNMFKNIKICKRKYVILSPIYMTFASFIQIISSYNNLVVFFHVPLILLFILLSILLFQGFGVIYFFEYYTFNFFAFPERRSKTRVKCAYLIYHTVYARAEMSSHCSSPGKSCWWLVGISNSQWAAYAAKCMLF